MAQDTVTSAVGTHNISSSARTLSSLPRIDYADQFTISTSADATPERWIRTMFGDVPSRSELFIWRGLLGLRLSRARSPATVAGWRIDGLGENWIRLEATSWFLRANLVAGKKEGTVSLVTFLHYRWWLARVVWVPLAAVHRRLVPGVLRNAVVKIRGS